MNELMLSDVLRHLKKNKIRVMVLFAIPLLLCVVYLWVVKPTFEASIIIAENNAPFSQAPKSLLGGGGDPFSMFGFGVEDGSINYQNYLFLITSDPVAERVFKDEIIRKKIYGDRWDEEKRKWVESKAIISVLINGVKRMLGQEIILEKDLTDFGQYIRDNVFATRLGNRALHKISFQHNDKEFALFFIKKLIAETEAIYRERILEEAIHIERFISEELSKDNNLVIKKKLAQIGEQYLYKKMSTKTPRSLVVEWITNPVVVNRPVKPRVVFVLFLGIFSGFLSVLIFGVYLRYLQTNSFSSSSDALKVSDSGDGYQ